jgi:hypothetical protein
MERVPRIFANKPSENAAAREGIAVLKVVGLPPA